MLLTGEVPIKDRGVKICLQTVPGGTGNGLPDRAAVHIMAESCTSSVSLVRGADETTGDPKKDPSPGQETRKNNRSFLRRSHPGSVLSAGQTTDSPEN